MQFVNKNFTSTDDSGEMDASPGAAFLTQNFVFATKPPGQQP
jgi:hypothetical protein